MGEEDEVYELVRSVIMSQKGGVLLKDLNRDYISLAGEPIPYAKLGFKSVEELLDRIPEIKRSVNQDGKILYTSTGKNCEHLVGLISKQKSSKNPKIKSKSKINHSKYEEADPQYNDYSFEHKTGKFGQRNAKLRTDSGAKESGHEKSLTDKNKYVTKDKNRSNIRERMGWAQEFLSEEDIHEFSQRRRNHRKHSEDRIQNLHDSFSFEEKISPFYDSRPVLKDNRHDNYQSLNKSSRVNEIPPQYAGSSKYGNLNYDNKWSDGSHESRGSLNTRHKDYRTQEMKHPSNSNRPDHKGLHYKGVGRQSDNFTDKYSSHHDSPKSRMRCYHDTDELDGYGRELFDGRRSSPNYVYQRRHSWEDGNRMDQYSKDYTSGYAGRKIDFVSGNLLVTIKNL